MRKRILCLFFALLLIVPFILTSCKKELSEQEQIEKIKNSGDVAFTLSIWIPTNSDVNDQAFKDNLKAIQDQINVELKKTYSTQIEITAIPANEYQEKLAQKITSIKQSTILTEEDKKDSDKLQLPSTVADSYTNVVEKDPDTGRYFIKYPELLSNQIDIFYISGKENYQHFIKDQALYNLTKVLDVQTGSYKDIRKMISHYVLDSYKINNEIYAIPNNHQYVNSTNYKYVLVNKELFAEYCEGAKYPTNLADCESFINLVGEAGLEGVIPFVGGVDLKYVSGLYDLPDLDGIDFDLISGSATSATPSTIFDSTEFIDYIKLYKKLSESSYTSSSLSEGEKAAVMVLTGTDGDVIDYADEYEIIRTELPFTTEEAIFDGMFAVSRYSANYERALRIMYLLQTDSDLITALQYGLEGKTYTLDTNDDGENVVNLIKDENGKPIYDMSGLNIGNSYHTYISDGGSVEDWDNIKYYKNYNAIIDPYANFADNYNVKASAEQKEQLNALTTKYSAFAQEVLTAINAMSLEEFEQFITLYSTDIDALVASIEEYENKTEPTQEETEEYEQNVALRDAYNSNTLIIELHSEEFQSLEKLYQDLYNKCK